MPAPSTPYTPQSINSSQWSGQAINSTGWSPENLLPFVGNLLQEDGVSHIIQEDGSSKIQLE